MLSVNVLINFLSTSPRTSVFENKIKMVTSYFFDYSVVQLGILFA